MARVSVRNGWRLGVLVALGLAFAVSIAQATPRPRARRVLNLFSGFLGRQNVNRFDCGLSAVGQVCVDPLGSTTVGGGFWPKGQPNQYVFNSGLQLAGIVDPAAGFAWANDTVGAFWFDPKGTTEHGDRLSLVWNSLDIADNAGWPRDAYVPDDVSLYHPVLHGLKAASQQDTWARYWDGNPQNNAGRKHPLGILVDQRGMAWNFPTGNEDIIYYLYTFTNISASDQAVYAGRPDADSLTRYGARFQALNEAAFGVQIPDGGYTITDMYASFAMDADVSDAARENYSTAFLPFSMGTAFKRNWFAPTMRFAGGELDQIHSAPFVRAPGIVGVKYLKSPVVGGQEVGLTMFSNTINGGAFDDAQNTVQLWRYLSAKLDPSSGDAACNAPGDPEVNKVCYVAQNSDDVRFFQSSGPMSLAPGQSATIVVAYIAAAPVGTPAIAGRSQGFDLKPGFPAQPAGLAAGTDTLRSVDRVFGATGFNDDNGNGRIEQTEVRTVPRSLLDKGLVAQAVFNNKFLLPFPPASPQFFLVPGDNQVTIVWQQSTTETDAAGDPYFQIASQDSVIDPTTGFLVANALFDPNYRQRDVEGYRVYRGRTSGDLQLIAQSDYTGTLMTDWTAAFDYGACAPELGLDSAYIRGCPQEVDSTTRRFSVGEDHDLVGATVQVPPGGRVASLPDTTIVVLTADTAVVGGGDESACRPSVCLALANTGVPFAYTDKGVRNSFTYFYAVTAFDVNSIKSVGARNTSLESPRVVKSVTPRKGSGQQTAGSITSTQVLNATGQVVPDRALPTINSATGIFSGPMPPSNGVTLGLASFIPEVLNSGSLQLRVDSIRSGFGDPDAIGTYRDAIYYVTVQGAGAPQSFVVPIHADGFEIHTSAGINFAATPITHGKSTRFGGDSTFSLYGSATIEQAAPWSAGGQGRGDANAHPPNSAYNGPRWWADSPNETTPNPNGSNCSPSVGTCALGAMTGKITAGALPGVDVLWQMQSYNTVNSVPMRSMEAFTNTVYRAADIKVKWGAGGVIDTVFDLVHGYPVPFRTDMHASWGILDTSSFAGVTGAPDTRNGLLTWSDIFCIAPSQQLFLTCGTTPAVLRNTARLSPINSNATTFANTATLATPTGDGFIFYLNGKFFVMQMAALPAAGTEWFVRFYSGAVTGSAAGGDFAFEPAPRSAAIPGLRVQVAFEGASFNPATTTAAALERVHTVPDPYYVTNALEQSPNQKKLRFVNVPSQSIIRIYSLSGVLVQVLTLNDVTGGGEAEWNLRNRNNQFVASGVYFYHVEAADGKTKLGRFTVVNFAQ